MIGARSGEDRQKERNNITAAYNLYYGMVLGREEEKDIPNQAQIMSTFY